MENNKDKLFVGGDISGIQKFIYNITSKKAAVSLKGRSEWLDRYLMGVYEKILKLPQTEGIYCGGGKLYLIAPNADAVKEQILQIHKQEELYLWTEHYGQVALHIAVVPYQDEFGENFRLANEEFARQKNQKFKSIIDENYPNFYEVQEVGGTPDVCAITGIEGKTVSLADDADIRVLPSVKEQIEIGQEKRKKQGITKTFEHYAKDSYLGVLRMDVDNLGIAFQSCKTQEEYKYFSERLTHFFKQDLDKLWHEIYHDDTDIIYAGGDDVFIVGKWNVVIDFAERIYKEFKQTFQECTLSAGLIIVSGKFPIAKAAELAGEAEDIAKAYNNKEKNAFCFLGRAVSWNKEFEEVKQQKAHFVKLIDNGMPRSILHRMMQFYDMQQRGEMRYLWNAAYYLKRFCERNKDIKGVKELCSDLKKEIPNSQELANIALAARWAELETKQTKS